MAKKTDGGVQYGADAYLVVPDPESPSTWKLRFKNENGEIDNRLLGACRAALTSNYRGNPVQLTDSQRAEAMSKLKKLYDQAGLKFDEATPDRDDVAFIESMDFVDPPPGVARIATRDELVAAARTFKDISHLHPAARYLTQRAIELDAVDRLPETWQTAKAQQAQDDRRASDQVGDLDQVEGGDAQDGKKWYHRYTERLRAQVKRHFKSSETMTEEQLDAIIRTAAAGTGGEASAEARRSVAASDDFYLASDDESLYWTMPLDFAEASHEWIEYGPRPATVDHPLYGKLEFTPESNAEIVANFNNGVFQKPIPINAEHRMSPDGAYGWIHEMALSDTGSVKARVSWTPLGQKALDEERFKFFSLELRKDWKDNFGKAWRNVAIGGALCVRPFFKPGLLAPLRASEDGWEEIPDNELSELTSTDRLDTKPHQNHTGETGMPDEGSNPTTGEAGQGQQPPNPEPGTTQQPNVITAAEADELRKKLEASDRIIAEMAERERKKDLALQFSEFDLDTDKAVGIAMNMSDDDLTAFSEILTDQAEKVKAADARLAQADKWAPLMHSFGDTQPGQQPESARAKVRAEAQKLMDADPKKFSNVFAAEAEVYKRNLVLASEVEDEDRKLQARA